MLLSEMIARLGELYLENGDVLIGEAITGIDINAGKVYFQTQSRAEQAQFEKDFAARKAAILRYKFI